MTFSTFTASPITPSASYTSRRGGGDSTSAGPGRSSRGIGCYINNNNGVGKSTDSPVSLVGTFGTGGVAGNRGIIANSRRANAR